MSYDIAIIDAPLSDNDQEAKEEILALLNQWEASIEVKQRIGIPTHNKQQLYERLINRYSLEDTSDDDTPWAEALSLTDFCNPLVYIPLTYSKLDEALPFIIQSAHSFGFVVYDLSSELLHRGNGFLGFALTIEGMPTFFAPTQVQLERAITQLAPEGEPSFLTLDFDGNYVQIAGKADKYVVEYREVKGDTFKHWCAGRLHGYNNETVRVPTNDAYITVYSHEVMNSQEAENILLAFVHGRGRLTTYSWRDIYLEGIKT